MHFNLSSLFYIRLTRLLAVARLECLQLIRDRTSLALIVTVPALQIVLFGYAVNLNPKNIPLVIARTLDGVPDALHQKIVETESLASLHGI